MRYLIIVVWGIIYLSHICPMTDATGTDAQTLQPFIRENVDTGGNRLH